MVDESFMAGKSSENEDLLKEIRRKDGIIESLNQNIVDLNKINEELASDLMKFENFTTHSIVWNTYQIFTTRFITKIIPPNSYRGEFYFRVLVVMKKMFGSRDGQVRPGDTARTYCEEPGQVPVEDNHGLSESYYRAFYLYLRRNATIKSPVYEEARDNPPIIDEKTPGLLAFYLPQYHPIPENDMWWGKGFTDWINVVKALPQFVGHYQPHLPDELGFYDLRRIETLTRQIDLARQFGIHGFCFHYYWFDGKKLLERPLNQFLTHPELQFNFCICWANENWTRRWDGKENEILIAQEYSPGYELAFIRDLDPVMRDPRYIRIKGKPLILVYCAQNLPDAKNCASIWREYCREQGIGEIFLVAAQTFSFKDPRPLGFDASVEFPPHNLRSSGDITGSINPVNPDFSGAIKDYRKIVEEKLFAFESPFTLFKCVAPGWDNTARRINNPLILQGSTPALYRRWLIDMMNHTVNNLQPDEQFVFINAWNEWAEGAHLEPDRKFGYAYLNATAEALQEMQKKKILTSG